MILDSPSIELFKNSLTSGLGILRFLNPMMLFNGVCVSPVYVFVGEGSSLTRSFDGLLALLDEQSTIK